MQSKIVRIKKLQAVEITVTAEIERMAELLIKTGGYSAILPNLCRTDYRFDNESYGILSGEKIIAAAQLAAKTSKLTLLQVIIADSREDEKIVREMLELEAGSQQAQKTELTTEERLERIESKLGL